MRRGLLRALQLLERKQVAVIANKNRAVFATALMLVRETGLESVLN